jgi:hypothetical protein
MKVEEGLLWKQTGISGKGRKNREGKREVHMIKYVVCMCENASIRPIILYN